MASRMRDRVRCIPGPPGWSWSAYPGAVVAAAVLAVPCLVLLTTQAQAACETRIEIDLRVAESPCASGSLGDAEPARVADIGAGWRWRDWSWETAAHGVDAGTTPTGSREMTHRGLLLPSAFPRTADRYELGDSLSDVHPYPRATPPERFWLWSALRYAAEVLTVTDGGGDESERPSRPWRTTIGKLLAMPETNHPPWTPDEAGHRQ